MRSCLTTSGAGAAAGDTVSAWSAESRQAVALALQQSSFGNKFIHTTQSPVSFSRFVIRNNSHSA
jgi:hypothetical protein